MSTEPRTADVELVKTVINHDYFRTIVREQVRESTKKYWTRWWAATTAILSTIAAILVFLGYEKFDVLEQRSSELNRKTGTIDEMLKLVKTEMTIANKSMESAEKLRSDSSDLVTESVKALTQANDNSFEAQRRINEAQKQIEVIQDTMDQVRDRSVELDALRTELGELHPRLNVLNEALEKKLEETAAWERRLAGIEESGFFWAFNAADSNSPPNCNNQFFGMTVCVGDISRRRLASFTINGESYENFGEPGNSIEFKGPDKAYAYRMQILDQTRRERLVVHASRTLIAR